MADIQIVRISQLPEASKVDLQDDVTIVFNSIAQKTLRKTWGELILATLRKFQSVLGTLADPDDRTMYLADATAGAFQITLPDAASSLGFQIKIKKIDVTANVVTVAGKGADLIDGAATKAIAAQWEGYTFNCNGTAWYIG